MKRFRTVALMAGLAALALPASSFGAGLPQSSAEPGAASGSPIDLGQLLTLGKSNSSKDSSKTNVLTLAGLDLLTKNGNVSGQATNSGLLAPVGDIVDALNGALCPAGPVDETGLCLSVLHSNASGDVESDDLGTRKRNNSSFATLVLTLGDQGIYVLGSAAASAELTPDGQPSNCTDLGGGYVLTFKGPLPAIPPDGLSRNSTSVGQAC